MKTDKLISLKIGANNYYGWESVDAARALNIASGHFSMSVSNLAMDLTEIRPGVECSVWYGDNVVMTCLIDEVSVDYDAHSHKVTVSGRSKTKDLIDCSALTTGSFKSDISPLEIAEKLAGDYNIPVKAYNLDWIKKFNGKFTVEPNGETVFSALEKLAELEQFSITDNEKGELVLFRIDKKTAKDSGNTIRHVLADDETNNVLHGAYSQKENDTYRTIEVRGQSKGNDQVFGKQVSNNSARHVNKNVTRNRTLIIQSQAEVTKDEMQNLANWEQAHRIGQAETWSYKLQGWRGENSLWRPGEMVTVLDDFLFSGESQLLIEEVAYSVSNNDGTLVNLKLVNFDAYAYKPITETDSKVDTSARQRRKVKLKRKGQLNKQDDDIILALPDEVKE